MPVPCSSCAVKPTMGGALILLALVLATVLWADPTSSAVWLTLFVTAAYGGIGYVDDAGNVRAYGAAKVRRALQALAEAKLAVHEGAYRTSVYRLPD